MHAAAQINSIARRNQSHGLANRFIGVVYGKTVVVVTSVP